MNRKHTRQVFNALRIPTLFAALALPSVPAWVALDGRQPPGISPGSAERYPVVRVLMK